MNQFETQRNIYKKHEEMSERRLLTHSEKVYNKFNLTHQKSRDLHERTTLTVEYHKEKNAERFLSRDEGLRRAADARADFIKREHQRHNQKVMARERILRNISIEQT